MIASVYAVHFMGETIMAMYKQFDKDRCVAMKGRREREEMREKERERERERGRGRRTTCLHK
jgi:hypothetical protein